ncbi:Mss4-like protein [Xylariomycetidae sp. FL2044]|nr:Mss4-like protein [Xylariomycetidae sp. FL2044]
MEGTCLCGAVKLRLELSGDDPPSPFLCHCTHCRKAAGSIASTNLAIKRDKVEITGNDNLQVFGDKGTDSGQVLYRHFCRTCGNPIMSTSKVLGDYVVVKLGIFHDIPKVTAEYYIAQRHVWVEPVKGAAQYRSMPGG